MRRLFQSLAFLAVALCAGCATSRTVTIPRAPEWRSPANTALITPQEIRLDLARVLPGVAVYTSDSAYIRVNHEWLEEFVRWTWDAQMALGFKYRANSRNCTKFAIGTFLAAANAAANAGVDAAPLVARLIVEQEHTFASVPGAVGTRHALNGVYTDRAPYYYVLEPQPSGALRLAPLASYPNPILGIVLGDYNP